MAKDIVINYSTGEIIEPRKNLTLGERFFSGGNPLPEDPTKPINPWAPKPTGPVLPNKMMAAKGGLARQPFAPKNEIRLAGTTIPGKYEAQAAMSKWLTNYTYADLLKDLKKGLTKMEIATNIYNNNKDLYDSMKITEVEYLKQYKNPEDAKIGKIANSIKNRLQKKPQLKTLHELNVKNLKRLDNSVVKDVDKWIKKNASKYKGKEGAITKFENDLFKFLNKNYSRLIKNAEGISESTKAGDKFISKFANLSNYATSTDEGANYRALKKKLYNALDIDWGRDMTGGGKKTYETANAAVKKLLPLAQEKGLIPKEYKHSRGTSKITPKNYFAWLQNTESNVMKKVFGNLLNFSVEHPGGLTRAAELLDSASLSKIISMEYGDLGENIKGKKITANQLKGTKYDTHLSRLIRDAKYKATNVTQANKILRDANKVSKKMTDEFGTLQSQYSAVKDAKGNIEIKVKHPNISLNDSLVNKTKNAIHTFIANDGMKRPVFKKLPIKLQESITLINNGKNANKIIASHLDDVIPNWKDTKGTTLRNFTGVVDFDMLPSGVSNAVTKATNALGKTLKVLGAASVPLDVIPFVQARNLGIDKWGKTGAKNLAQEYLNLPRTIEDLFYVAGEGTWKDFGSKKEEDRVFDYEPKTFGTKETVKALRNTSNEEIIENIKARWRDIGPGRLGIDSEDLGLEVENQEGIENRIKKALKQKVWADSLPPDHPLVVKEEVEVKETDNVLGTQIPMKSITEGFSRDQFMAKGGRVGFAEGSKDDKRTGEEILESIKKQVFELENNWNTEQNVFEKLGDVVDIRNIPYYADRAVKGGVNVAEVSAKLPFVAGELISDLIQKPGFKRVEREKSDDEMTELFMEQTGQDYRLKPTEVWGKAWDNIKPGAWSKKLGLDSLISDEELRMQEQGMSEWPKIAGSNIELGVDVTLPWGYVGAARKAKQLEKVIGKYIVPGANVDKKINDMLSTQGEGRRDFMKMAGSLGVIGTLKALGLDKLLKGVSRNPVPGSIKMLERSTTKMPVWFPKFIDKVNDRMTYRGDGMWDFKGTDDFLPGFHIERVGDDYYISGKNEYDQDFSITYESPKWEGDADGSYYNKGEFVVEDSVPMRSDPDGNVDFDGEVVEDLHDVLGGTKGMEEIATGEKIGLTRGDQQVIDAELRFQSEADMARDLADE